MKQIQPSLLPRSASTGKRDSAQPRLLRRPGTPLLAIAASVCATSAANHAHIPARLTRHLASRPGSRPGACQVRVRLHCSRAIM